MPNPIYVLPSPKVPSMLTIDAQEIAIPPRILSSIQAGEAIFIELEHQPLAILLPGGLPAAPRPAGLCKGEFTVPDDFNEPLEDWGDLFAPASP